jgi:hypothetical protein
MIQNEGRTRYTVSRKKRAKFTTCRTASTQNHVMWTTNTEERDMNTPN